MSDDVWADAMRADYYCPKCMHGLLESQTLLDPCAARRCPKCKDLVIAFSLATVIERVLMFKPKLARRVEVKVGTPQVARVRGDASLPTEQTIFDIAKAVVLVEKVLNRIADAIENDGKDPVLAIGEKPTDLWLLGDALEAIGRTDAAEIAYQASKDHEGDPPPVFG